MFCVKLCASLQLLCVGIVYMRLDVLARSRVWSCVRASMFVWCCFEPATITVQCNAVRPCKPDLRAMITFRFHQQCTNLLVEQLCLWYSFRMVWHTTPCSWFHNVETMSVLIHHNYNAANYSVRVCVCLLHYIATPFIVIDATSHALITLYARTLAIKFSNHETDRWKQWWWQRWWQQWRQRWAQTTSS